LNDSMLKTLLRDMLGTYAIVSGLFSGYYAVYISASRELD
jgi:hypothetical protein